jgi:uncharacterized protein DUF4845
MHFKHISQRQKGMTALGIFIILGMLACFVSFGLTVFPLYNEYWTVKSGMQSIVELPPAKRKNITDIRKYFLRNMEINNVNRFNRVTIKEYVTMQKSKDGKTKYLNVKYNSTNNWFHNITIMMEVDETVELPGSASQ